MKLNQDLNNKFNVVVCKKFCFAFSYSTLIAILDKENNIAYLSTEKYGTTTGKHKNRFKSDYIYSNTKVVELSENDLNKFADDLKI